jgi:hypothetical protein
VKGRGPTVYKAKLNTMENFKHGEKRLAREKKDCGW